MANMMTTPVIPASCSVLVACHSIGCDDAVHERPEADLQKPGDGGGIRRASQNSAQHLSSWLKPLTKRIGLFSPLHKHTAQHIYPERHSISYHHTSPHQTFISTFTP